MSRAEDALRQGLVPLGLVVAVAFLPRLVRRLRRSRQSAQITIEDLHTEMAGAQALLVLDVREAGGPAVMFPAPATYPWANWSSASRTWSFTATSPTAPSAATTACVWPMPCASRTPT